MPNAKPTECRDRLNLRIKPLDRGLTDRAAQLIGKTKAVCALDQARWVGEDSWLGGILFIAGQEAFDAFRVRLDGLPRPNDRLVRMLQTPCPLGIGVPLSTPGPIAETHEPGELLSGVP